MRTSTSAITRLLRICRILLTYALLASCARDGTSPNSPSQKCLWYDPPFALVSATRARLGHARAIGSPSHFPRHGPRADSRDRPLRGAPSRTEAGPEVTAPPALPGSPLASPRATDTVGNWNSSAPEFAVPSPSPLPSTIRGCHPDPSGGTASLLPVSIAGAAAAGGGSPQNGHLVGGNWTTKRAGASWFPSPSRPVSTSV